MNYDCSLYQKIFQTFNLWNDKKNDIFLVEKYPNKFLQDLFYTIVKTQLKIRDFGHHQLNFSSVETLDFFVPFYTEKNIVHILFPVKLINSVVNEGYYHRSLNNIDIRNRCSAFIVCFCVLIGYILLYISNYGNIVYDPSISKQEKIKYMNNNEFYNLLMSKLFYQKMIDPKLFMRNDFQLQKLKMINSFVKENSNRDSEELINKYIVDNDNINISSPEGNGLLMFLKTVFQKLFTVLLSKQSIGFRSCTKKYKDANIKTIQNFEFSIHIFEFLKNYLLCVPTMQNIKIKLETLSKELSNSKFSFSYVFDKYSKFLGLNMIYLEYTQNLGNDLKIGQLYQFTSIKIIDLLIGNLSSFTFLKYQNPFLVIDNSTVYSFEKIAKLFGASSQSSLSAGYDFVIPNLLNQDNNYFLFLNREGSISTTNIGNSIGNKKMKFDTEIEFQYNGRRIVYYLQGIIYSVHANNNIDFFFETGNINSTNLRFFKIQKEKIDFSYVMKKEEPKDYELKFSYDTNIGLPIYLFYFSPEIINNIK